MKRTTKTVRILSLAAVAVLGTSLAACGGGASTAGGDKAASGPVSAKGPIKIWYSNNEFEVKWGKDMVAAWNAAHPDEQIDAQEIPAGKSSEEVIGAAITAGNAPCLVFNTAPVAVPQFQKQGGLVALDSFPDGVQYIKDRTGDLADQYKSADGKMYQLPWKSNPVVLYYNKDLFTKAGLDAENPKLGTHEEFLETARTIVKSGAAENAIWPSPTADFYQPWFDFYPFYAANTDGTQLVKDGKATFDNEQGKQVAALFGTLYKENLSSKEAFKGDSFAEGKAAMSLAGPWAVPVYKGKINYASVPIPGAEAQGTGADAKGYTFSDAKNVAMYSACKNQGTAWEVMKFATSKEQDGKLLEASGQMPMRQDLPAAYPDYFAKNPAYVQFAEQAGRTVEVPNISNSVQVWQTFRDAWNKSVIFGNQGVDEAFKGASDKINQLAAQK